MVDVCLVVEGNYPYVTGGVSAWADDLLHSLGDDVSYAVAHVHAEGAPDVGPAYTPPAGVEVRRIAVEDREVLPEPGLHERLPEARVYHATATGTGGELARQAARTRGAGFALTEHGLAWRDLAAPAIWGMPKPPKPPKPPKSHHVRPDLDPQISAADRERIGRDAVHLARLAYAGAHAITSVCGPNALVQAHMGARRDRLRVIPNAVAPAAGRARDGEGFLTAFVGRVAPEKDLATFLRACSLVAAQRADARFAVVGPLDQDPGYADQCLELAADLDLGERVAFTGETDPAPWYARMDVLALTSTTEAQPLVALEAMAAGVPVVATDVGGCREAIGDAGLLTRVGDPEATAAAILRLAGDEVLRARTARAGLRRTAAHHDPARVHRAYRELYEQLAA